jgi:hypothetical protein
VDRGVRLENGTVPEQDLEVWTDDRRGLEGLQPRC